MIKSYQKTLKEFKKGTTGRELGTIAPAPSVRNSELVYAVHIYGLNRHTVLLPEPRKTKKPYSCFLNGFNISFRYVFMLKRVINVRIYLFIYLLRNQSVMVSNQDFGFLFAI